MINMINFRFCFAAVCLLAFLGIELANAKSLTDTQVKLKDIIVVKDIHYFARNHPGLKLQPMTKVPRRARSNTVQYSLGARVTGDRLVAQGSDVFAYPAKKDVTVQLTYPEAGTGSIVTYVDLSCLSDNEDGNAYVVAGGIGQRFISIVVEANQTENFSYQVQYYGTN